MIQIYNNKHLTWDGTTSINHYELFADTVADLPSDPYYFSSPEKGSYKIAQGSIAWVIDVSEIYMLDSEGTWVLETISGGGGGGGTTDYNVLTNKPSINSVELSGNKTLSDLGIQSVIDSSHKLSADLVSTSGTTNQFNMQADWNQATTTAGDYIKNKPTLGTAAATDATAYATAAQGTKADTAIQSAGTGLSASGTTLNHSNSVTAKTTQGFAQIAYDAQGHITGSTAATTAQADAINSGITSTDVAQIGLNKNNISLIVEDLKQPNYRELIDYHYGYQMGYYDTSAEFRTSTGWVCKKYDVSQYAGYNYKLKYVSQRQYGGQTLLEDIEGNITQIAPTSGGHYAEIESTFPSNVKYLYHSTQLTAFGGREFLIDNNTTALYPIPTIPDTPTNYTLLKRKSCVCFIFDDGYDTDIDIKAVFDAAGVKCGFAPIDVKDRYIEYYKEGYSILAHGNSLPSTMNETNVRNFLTERKNVVEARGISCNGWVTPSSALDAQYRHIVYDLFKYGFTVYKGAETSNVHIPITTKSYDLWRSDVDYNTVATCKSIIDEGIANNDMIVFYGHNAANLTNLAEVIAYAKTNSQVLSPDECMNYFYAYRVNEDRYTPTE